MSIQTPRQRGAARGTTSASLSPNLRLSSVNQASTAVNRKLSLHTVPASKPTTPAANMADVDLAVGDLVDVPGDMYGTVKFVGSVRGKAGRFVGVELNRDFAARGKNDGDVEGTSYFTTSIPGSGIFLPAHRAERRTSPVLNIDESPGTPGTPSYGTYRGLPQGPDDYAPPTPSLPKFSQSVGPGAARPTSPQFKLKSRPSLPRPESPLRKPPTLAPSPNRTFSMSQRGGVAPKLSASPAPPRSTTPRAASTTRGPPPSRPYSRNGSRLGHRNDTILEPGATHNPLRPPSRQTHSRQDDDIKRLLEQLEDKDRQLKDQATTLAEMDASLKEIQSLIPTGEDANGPDEGGDVAQLRQALHEKNDKIQSLVDEFDAHRADFRSTIDTLELASAETERVYEAKVGDLLAELQELRELGHGREEVEQVAQQLRGLEELVAELEDGLEDARRGEAEARGEVEFLRGEVERGRSELRREREKAAKALQGAKEVEGMQTRDQDMETKDDEIRGLKAIILSLSSGPEIASPVRGGSAHAPSRSLDMEELERTQEAVQQLEREKSELQGLVERKGFREEELERAIEQLRKAAQDERDSILNDAPPSPGVARRPKALSPTKTWRSHQSPIPHEEEENTFEHHADAADASPLPSEHEYEHEYEHEQEYEHEHEHEHEHDLSEQMGHLDLSSRNEEYEQGDASPLDSHTDFNHAEQDKHEGGDDAVAGDADADKWCALCEKDGHFAFDCPEEL